VNKVKEISQILYEEDPINLKSPNKNEYESEAVVINKLLKEKYFSKDSLLNTIYSIFVSQFNYALDTMGNTHYINCVGDKENLRKASNRIYYIINKIFPCVMCGGNVYNIGKPGRMWLLRKDLDVEIPSWFKLPTCIECGEFYMTAELSKKLNFFLEESLKDVG
jgi:hypothetical protein